jgi:hypothetical protein
MKSLKVIIGAALLLMFTGCIPDGTEETLEGSWSCMETSTIFMENLKGTTIYPVYFAQDVVDDNTYYIDNFYQLGDGVDVKIKVSGHSLILEPQTVDGIRFEGTGTIDTSYELITFSYTADDDGGEIDHVQSEYTR